MGDTWQVFLPGHWPSYTDIHERPGSHYASRSFKRKWQNDVGLQLKAARPRIPPLERVYLSYLHRRKDRKSDRSNLAAAAMKIIEDAMVEIELIPNDGWNRVLGFEHRFEITSREGVLVTITAR